MQLTLDQCRAVRIKPAEGKVEALSDIASLTEHLDTLKGYSSIADGLYGTFITWVVSHNLIFKVVVICMITWVVVHLFIPSSDKDTYMLCFLPLFVSHCHITLCRHCSTYRRACSQSQLWALTPCCGCGVRPIRFVCCFDSSSCRFEANHTWKRYERTCTSNTTTSHVILDNLLLWYSLSCYVISYHTMSSRRNSESGIHSDGQPAQ